MPEITSGRVIKVYDGDTITIISKYHDKVYKFHIRLRDIDTPELKSKSAYEKKCATYVRDKLHELIFDKIVEIKNIGPEKFGRLLADIYLGDINISKWLLDNGLGYKYDGKTKVDATYWNELFKTKIV